MGYKSDAQRKAVHASKADGGAGNPNKMKSGFKMKYTDGKKASPNKFFKSMMGGLNRIPGAGGLLGTLTDDKLGLEDKLRSTLNKRAEQKAEETIDKVVNNESEEGLV
tara:strand:- start:523 stop:846 length:324 start_codon:yes stop_codon:yes gene_type:complete